MSNEREACAAWRNDFFDRTSREPTPTEAWYAALKWQAARQSAGGWIRAIDEAMVVTHLSIAEATDDYEVAKKKLAALIQWHVTVALDPATSVDAQALIDQGRQSAGATGQEPVCEHEWRPMLEPHKECVKCGDVRRDLSAATGQEPVAKVHYEHWGVKVQWLVDPPPPKGTLLYAAPIGDNGENKCPHPFALSAKESEETAVAHAFGGKPVDPCDCIACVRMRGHQYGEALSQPAGGNNVAMMWVLNEILDHCDVPANEYSRGRIARIAVRELKRAAQPAGGSGSAAWDYGNCLVNAKLDPSYAQPSNEPIPQHLEDDAWDAFQKHPESQMSNSDDFWPIWRDAWDAAREQPAESKRVAWVALTDEDRKAAFESLPDMLDGFLKTWGWLHFAKEIERRCKEKNAHLESKRMELSASELEAIEWAAGEAYSYAKSAIGGVAGVSTMSKRWRSLNELFARASAKGE